MLRLRHSRCTQASQVRECPGEPYSSVPISCCLFVFLYLLNMKGGSSWEPGICQDVVAWGCVVSLGVVQWCLGTCAADVGPSSHGNGKQREALLMVPGSLLRNMVMIEVYSIAKLDSEFYIQICLWYVGDAQCRFYDSSSKKGGGRERQGLRKVTQTSLRFAR